MINDSDMHPLLRRQIKMSRLANPNGEIDTADLLKMISQSYEQADLSRTRLERSISVTSEELGELYTEAQKSCEEARKANAFKSQFLANMSHEIRTPLNGLLGFTGLLQRTELDDKQAQYLEIITLSGNSLKSLLNDLLDLSKIEAGKLTLNNSVFDPRLIIQASLDIFKGQAALKAVDLFVNFDPMLAQTLVGDSARLSQILNNLIGNAMKFTDEGSITVDVKISEPQDESQTLCVSVSDTGIGISEDKTALIFESYTQAETSTQNEFGGTGLGLPICKELSELMGGKISVTSELGRGTEFKIEIPFQVKDKAPNEYNHNTDYQQSA